MNDSTNIIVAVTSRVKHRAIAALIVAASVGGIFLSQFLIWSVACGALKLRLRHSGAPVSRALERLLAALTLPRFGLFRRNVLAGRTSWARRADCARWAWNRGARWTGRGRLER